ncbi:MAG TPA: PhzF family phenazine biosynthesis protein [Noviherbaspirillum sp.]|jgi:PhzF family phenazine biosynthesis protein|uniref:PhzF family phenazine biosynthesis protein n=1 Tax=Noviherbaspirillum sp. TaxID=1926288 RepID=UPI002F941CEF
MQRRFRQVDVFTQVPYLGNPVAVVLDGDGLTTAQMQAISRWTNLSETTFVCRPEDARADYRLRIFCPDHEMRFAGHPTIGSAHAVLASGYVPKQEGVLVQECGVGLVQLRVNGDGMRVALPPASFIPVEAGVRAAVEEAIGAAFVEDPVIVDLGVAWLTGRVASGELLRGLEPDMRAVAAAGMRAGGAGINVFGLDGDVVEVRSLIPHAGTPEDPVCGSGNGAVAYYLRERRGPVDYQARQGRCLGRDGRVAIAYESDTVWLGGQAVSCIEGHILA